MSFGGALTDSVTDGGAVTSDSALVVTGRLPAKGHVSFGGALTDPVIVGTTVTIKLRLQACKVPPESLALEFRLPTLRSRWRLTLAYTDSH